MKRIKVLSMFLLVAMMATVFVGCSKDDDDTPVDLKSYAVGSWRSYKVSALKLDGERAGETKEATVDKTGDFADFYWEMNLYENGNGIFYEFEKDGEGIDRWVDIPVTYSVKGNVLTVKDSELSFDFVFNPDDRTLSYQTPETYEGVSLTLTIYMKK